MSSSFNNGNIIPVITIDGPSGVGKGTLSRRLSNILGWNLLDSGIIYRILASIALDNNIDTNNEIKLIMLIPLIKIDFLRKNNRFIVLLNKKEIDKNIYTEIIGNLASKIAIFPKLRASLLRYQRKFCIWPGLVADGRDMGTIVFPNAMVKIFLYASERKREQRRLDQLQKTNFNVNFNCLLSQIRERDNRDYTRKIAPLIPSVDALMLDSTDLSENEVTNKVLTYMKQVDIPLCNI
ncbi:cytidylate kinase [Candidatus Blochmanniella vafra str. BVAF]|uniref:Cytidylate kinase n=2 Tax=Candidatus Blochmanniella vafra TaxID=251535 RepID=E8Q683_BLOVB|nr:cytidylate kinase [Candidatus Blochmannia vafer str. BVAF]